MLQVSASYITPVYFVLQSHNISLSSAPVLDVLWKDHL